MDEKKGPEFICDTMFGKLAKWLRMLGYFSLYIKGNERARFLKNLKLKENQILITKDRKIKDETINIFYLDQNYINEQFKIIVNNFNLNSDNSFTICMECNKPLKDTKKEKNKEKIPDFVYKNFVDFKECKKCGRIYWNGSHYEEMLKKIKKFIK